MRVHRCSAAVEGKENRASEPPSLRLDKFPPPHQPTKNRKRQESDTMVSDELGLWSSDGLAFVSPSYLHGAEDQFEHRVRDKQYLRARPIH